MHSLKVSKRVRGKCYPGLYALVLGTVFCGSVAAGVAQTAAPQPAPKSAPKKTSHSATASVAPSSPLDPFEDWTTPDLAKSRLPLVPPVVGEKDDLADFTRELLRAQWRPSDPIDLYVIRPKGVEKPPVVLYLYGHPTETTRFQDDDFCRLLVKNGYAAVGFVPALSGQRYHDRPMKEWYVSEMQETLATSAHDVQMILNYLATRGDTDMNRVAMFGQGSGASIAILAAAVDPRIKVLDLMDPWGDWPHWMAESTRIPDNERANFLKPEFLEKIAPLDPVQWLPRLKTPAVRIQIADFDTITPKVAKNAIAKAAPASVTLTRYENSQQVRDALLLGKEFDWLKAQLPPANGVAAKTVSPAK
jgi:acetyl esterase/lipase